MSVTAYRRGRTVRTVSASVLTVAALTLTTAFSGSEATGSTAGDKADAAGLSSTAGSNTADGSSKGEPIGDCDINKTVFSVQSVERPVNHLLLTATNGAGVDCKLSGFPFLKFGDSQAATPQIEASKPQSVPVLAPGESAYAGITTSAADGSGSHGRVENSLEVFIQGNEDGTDVELPGGSVFVDSSAEVTYWQTDVEDALAW
ncbi:DUF4232 domain-containing protein [Streptomyces sp. HC44]|uniref:DUF4232 domain-containing protein n=1 Tax=Streptomyces scabichelini TaxID=2711217 RepID=A0A6G4V695_9ACTN|nr:DUF4232 domain-containing protein [Streptomyces scabichelini]NGO09546.1 DUF4232 domain-containing protein [Streptomyces scabichelini]